MDFLKWLWNIKYDTEDKCIFFGILYAFITGISMVAYKPLALILILLLLFAGGMAVLAVMFYAARSVYREYKADKESWERYLKEYPPQ